MNPQSYPLIKAYWDQAFHADLALGLLLFVVWFVIDLYFDVRRYFRRFLRLFREVLMALFFGWTIISILLYLNLCK